MADGGPHLAVMPPGRGPLCFLWPNYPIVALFVLGVLLAMQSSLMHEAAHGHPTRKAWINELLVGLPIGLVYPFRRFKSLHLRHHADERLTDPFDDPESYYRALWHHEELPPALKAVLKVNNTMIGRFVHRPAAGDGRVPGDRSAARSPPATPRRARPGRCTPAGLLIVLPIVVFVFDIPLWLYVLAPVWLGQALISVRTFAEHQWSETARRAHHHHRALAAGLPVPQQQSASRAPQEPQCGVVPAAEAFPRPPRAVDRDEQRLCLPRLFRAAEGVRVQAEGAGGSSGPAPRAGSRPRVPPARQGAQRCGLGTAPVPAEPPKE